MYIVIYEIQFLWHFFLDPGYSPGRTHIFLPLSTLCCFFFWLWCPFIHGLSIISPLPFSLPLHVVVSLCVFKTSTCYSLSVKDGHPPLKMAKCHQVIQYSDAKSRTLPANAPLDGLPTGHHYSMGHWIFGTIFRPRTSTSANISRQNSMTSGHITFCVTLDNRHLTLVLQSPDNFRLYSGLRTQNILWDSG